MITLKEKFPCNDNDELHARERFYIDNNDCVNKNIPGRTAEEYKNDNKVKISEQKKEKYDCNCGGKYTNQNKARHEKTTKHTNYVASLQA